MPQKIVDLSDLLSDDKFVRFRRDGETYRLPGDIPAPLFLLIQQEAERQQENPGADIGGLVGSMSEQILKLFQYGQPDMKSLPDEVTLTQLVTLIARVYGPDQQQQVDPTPTKRSSAGGTRSTRPKRQSKSSS